jgi:phage tail tape-measure protein
MEEKHVDEKEQIGSVAGLGAGMLTGARVGSIVIPVPVLGTFVGALAGGVLGSEIGKRIVPAVLNGAGAFVQTLTAPAQSSTPEPAKAEATEDKQD